MAHKQQQLSFLLLLLIFSHIIIACYGAPPLSNDANALLKVKASLIDKFGALTSWTSTTLPCLGKKNNWVGIICSRGGNIWGLRLENMRLEGLIDVDALAELPRLRSISLINNSFGGQMHDFRKLRALKSIYLSHNKFEGNIDPNAFEGMRRLRKIHLEYNNFSGEFPTSLMTLSRIVELRLDNNQFQGGLPNLQLSSSLHVFNVSNNLFVGPIPTSLAKFDASAFQGNEELCGPPLQEQCNETIPIPTPTQQLKPSPTPLEDSIPIIALVFGIIIAMILAIMVILMIIYRRNDNAGPPPTRDGQPRDLEQQQSQKHVGKGSQRGTNNNNANNSKYENGKLTFVNKEIERFDLPDLLKASAEILGSGCFGSCYKATLNNGNVVVVKRFKMMNNVGRDDFQEHLRRLGRVCHPNLLPLVAYYYRKEEKLFISDPMSKGSLAFLLHGQTKGNPSLDWPTRLKIIKGVARGLSYLYEELPILVAPHGHLKSSNVLLNNSFEPKLSDYGLIPLINQESVQEMMIAYKSPEYFNNGRITKKTDVWSLGILILETLSGKFPSIYLENGNNNNNKSEVDVSNWVKNVVDDEGFDESMGNTKNCEGEMQKLLDIGLACCESNVEKRFDMKKAYDMIEEVRECDNDDDFFSTGASVEVESVDARSSRGMSDDFTLSIT
ncbi:hypothetical protein RND81_10G179100 [Saponaria officinalis]|uniref:Protein kinase domain-containing protein n=1 Tax=Saponaria officinalis TaxID=3572 RepID=A0AAW1I3B5_SAPOF